MSYITLAAANAWTDKSKLNLTSVDSELESSVAVQVLAQLSAAYETSSWVDSNTTPELVKKIIAMYYVGWYYQRVYSEDDSTDSYGMLLLAQADRLIAGILSGTLVIDGTATGGDVGGQGQPLFYPTDLSSAQDPTFDDSSLGGPKFSMGTIW